VCFGFSPLVYFQRLFFFLPDLFGKKRHRAKDPVQVHKHNTQEVAELNTASAGRSFGGAYAPKCVIADCGSAAGLLGGVAVFRSGDLDLISVCVNPVDQGARMFGMLATECCQRIPSGCRRPQRDDLARYQPIPDHRLQPRRERWRISRAYGPLQDIEALRLVPKLARDLEAPFVIEGASACRRVHDVALLGAAAAGSTSHSGQKKARPLFRARFC
jgi:hypothetical protein